MSIRQQIQIALLPLLFAALACTIQLPNNLAGYDATPIPPPPTGAPTVAGDTIPAPIVNNTAVATAPQVADSTSITTNVAADLPFPAALGEQSRESLIESLAFVSAFSVDEINQLQAEFYPASNQLPAQFGVDRLKLLFKSRNEMGRWVPIRAEIFIPRVNTPTEFPLFVYGAGTTGIGNLCAPLDEDIRGRNWGQYQSHLVSYAAQGFITVLAHWQGYDDQTRTHNYFIAELEASTLLDATRATYELFNNNMLTNVAARPAQAVFYGGYSQGGHGAFAALDAASYYAPEIPIKGIVGHATSPNVEALMRERPSLAPYIVYSFQNYYGRDLINPEDVFLPRWLPNFYADASTKCVDEAYRYYPSDPNQIYKPEFFDILYGNRLAEVYPDFAQALEANHVGGTPWANVPVFLFHGAADTIVTPQTHERFVARLCNGVENVNFRLYNDVNHFQTRQFSFIDSVTWMRNVLAGQNQGSQCSEFFTSQID